jgi:hypothetical protein
VRGEVQVSLLAPVLERARRLDGIWRGWRGVANQRGTHLKHLDVCPRREDDAVDAKDTEEDVVRGDGVELTTKLERASSAPS